MNDYFDLDGKANPDGTPRRITAADIERKLPDIADFTRTYLGVDPVRQPMPVQPTAHYAMGGIPTNVHGQVLVDEAGATAPGFYAAGECRASVHGANRLGTNSLNDILVFGRRAGQHMAAYCRETALKPLPADPAAGVKKRLGKLRLSSGGVRVGRFARSHATGDDEARGRTEEGMQTALGEVRQLQQDFARVQVDDTDLTFNTDILEALQTQNLLDLAEVIAAGALARQESRGDAREDYKKRDDERWLRHTLAFRRPDGKVELRYKPVVITRYQPKERVY